MELQINNKVYQVQSPPDTPLLWVIRDELGLTGTKYGCGLAQCGACSVMLDGEVIRSCVMPIEGLAGRKITTIESIEEDPVGKRVVEAWVKHQVPQCGYCQSGQVMAATALLKQTTKPTDEQIGAAMVNLCRCGTYNAIRAAVHDLTGTSGAQKVAVTDTPQQAQNGQQNREAGVAVAAAGVGTLNIISNQASTPIVDAKDAS